MSSGEFVQHSKILPSHISLFEYLWNILELNVEW
ncbi:hypothetical protein Smp_184510 [Schistosoma mansoni]|nr:hypothetical protein Smp_184510 [Schistosoma mansoni]|eukprot:XP_018644536.1 hypothetical protein Smp_184510 [Schistosoma mansoni]